MQNERGQNTHGQGERVKIPLLPNNVGKKSTNNVGPQQGHNKYYSVAIYILINKYWIKLVFSFSLANCLRSM